MTSQWLTLQWQGRAFVKFGVLRIAREILGLAIVLQLVVWFGSTSNALASGTLRADKYLPDWVMRDLVQEVLLAEMRSGKPLFYE